MISRVNVLVLPLIAVLSGCATNPSADSAVTPLAPAPPAPIVIVVTATPAPTMVAVASIPTPTSEPAPLPPPVAPVVMDRRSPDKIRESLINELGTKILNATTQSEVQLVKNMVVMARQDAQACKPDSIDPRTWSQIALNGLFQEALRHLEQAADYKAGALNGAFYQDALATSSVNTAAAIVATERRPSERGDMVAKVAEQTCITTGRTR